MDILNLIKTSLKSAPIALNNFYPRKYLQKEKKKKKKKKKKRNNNNNKKTCTFKKLSPGLFLITFITKTCLFKYIDNFSTKKYENFQIKNFDIFLISAQNIDCGYSLEPPHQGGSNKYPQSMFWAEIRKIMYTPVNPSFTI